MTANPAESRTTMRKSIVLDRLHTLALAAKARTSPLSQTHALLTADGACPTFWTVEPNASGVNLPHPAYAPQRGFNLQVQHTKNWPC